MSGRSLSSGTQSWVTGLRQVRADQTVDVTVEGRRQQHPLAAGRRGRDELADDREEAEVAQVVGLVEHEHLDPVEAASVAVDEVLEPAGSGDDDVGAGAQPLDLPVVRRAAVDGRQLEADGVGQRLHRRADLTGELTGRHDDEGARGLRLALGAGEPGQDGQAEGQRLTGAGGSAAEHVAAGDGVGQHCCLDRGGGGDLGASERLHDGGRKAELGKVGMVDRHVEVLRTGGDQRHPNPRRDWARIGEPWGTQSALILGRPLLRTPVTGTNKAPNLLELAAAVQIEAGSTLG